MFSGGSKGNIWKKWVKLPETRCEVSFSKMSGIHITCRKILKCIRGKAMLLKFIASASK